MPNDAKLGLVVGVALVIAVAVVFFRREAPAGGPATNVQPGPAMMPPAPTTTNAFARTTSRGGEREGWAGQGRLHTVRDGETLFGLARRYYGDGEKSSELFRVNRGRLLAPDRLPAGTVLVIPDAPERAAAGAGP
ncbi:MAG TPA: LysM domain-containing protein [Gemmataceae bacterium]|nr:LysM domain-containing protein [Gemmataceae bacterium]